MHWQLQGGGAGSLAAYRDASDSSLRRCAGNNCARCSIRPCYLHSGSTARRSVGLLLLLAGAGPHSLWAPFQGWAALRLHPTTTCDPRGHPLTEAGHARGRRCSHSGPRGSSADERRRGRSHVLHDGGRVHEPLAKARAEQAAGHVFPERSQHQARSVGAVELGGPRDARTRDGR